jgi:hypothetical protein
MLISFSFFPIQFNFPPLLLHFDCRKEGLEIAGAKTLKVMDKLESSNTQISPPHFRIYIEIVPLDNLQEESGSLKQILGNFNYKIPI